MVPETVEVLNSGLGRAFDKTENIAIIVLLLALGYSGIMNFIQWFTMVKLVRDHRTEMALVEENRRKDTDRLLTLAFERVDIDNRTVGLLQLIDEKVSHVKK